MNNIRFRVAISSIFDCSLERAFKTPFLCDVTKIHTGYGLMPKVTHTSDDQNWGQPNSTKKVYVAASVTQKGGFASMDKIIKREENKFWEVEVYDFQSWMLNFYKFEGTWKTSQLATNKILVDYEYTLNANSSALYPLNWLFAHGFWKRYMKRVLENVRKLAMEKEPYLYP